jgi:hypothetical protein
MTWRFLEFLAYATLVSALMAQSRQDRPAHRAAFEEPGVQPTPADSGRQAVPPQWWEKAAAIVRVSLMPSRDRASLSLDVAKASSQLDEFHSRGISAVEIFAPAYGGVSYGGLDAKDRYRVDPTAGTMDDFRRLVTLAHSKGMPVITFDNLGYISVDAPEWLKACDDVKAGRTTRESQWFRWSDRADAPAPAGDSIFMVPADVLPVLWRRGNGDVPIQPIDTTRKHGGDFRRTMAPGQWQYSSRAGKYYWSKWWGTDDAGNDVQLPHYNWSVRGWQEEAEKIIRFWMSTGLDGMIMDAPNWYIDCGWDLHRRRITGVIGSYGNVYMQAEGAGALYEDPGVWITEGGYNSVQDYALGDLWGNPSPIRMAIDNGDPRPIEVAFRKYHDRVVQAGGTLYFAVGERLRISDPLKQHLAVAVAALGGDMIQFSYAQALQIPPQTQALLKLKQAHPALHNSGGRRQIPTNADDKFYAILRTAADQSERILVVMNFQSTAQTAEVDLSGVATAGLVDLENRAETLRTSSLKVDLPAYGYRVYQVKPPSRLP